MTTKKQPSKAKTTRGAATTTAKSDANGTLHVAPAPRQEVAASTPVTKPAANEQQPANRSSSNGARANNDGIERDKSGLSYGERMQMIADAAYYRAEQRGFTPGYELEDWISAERQIASMLSSQQSN